MAAKYGMVLDVDRCIGCYTCVVACKMCYGTRPGVNYNGVERVEWGQYPDAHQRFRLTMCMHCEDAPCVSVCPVKATHKTEEGAVIMDYDTCIGCGACVTACPYDQRHLVVDDETSFNGDVAPFEEDASKRLNVVEKCTFCYGRVKNNEQPMCTVHCPGQCRIFGDVNDPESDVSKYIKEKDAVAVEGTSMYYVIPQGMDRDLLPPTLAVAMANQTKAAQGPAATSEASEASQAPETSGEAETAKSGVSTGAVVGVVAAAAAAGIGGYAYKKSKDKKAGDGSDNSQGGDQ